jgi:Tfp pilus assembly protein PilF
MNLGTAYQAGNKNDKAAAEYRRAIQLDAKNPDAHYFLATVLEALNQKPLAIKEYEEYLRLAPSGSYATDIRARLKLLRGR